MNLCRRENSFIFYARGRGDSVQKTLRGCAADMVSKISHLVYEWPIIKHRFWYLNGSIFQNFPKLSQNWLKFIRKFWKNRTILLKIRAKIGQIGIWMGHCFLKNWYLYGPTFKFCGGMHDDQTWVGYLRAYFWKLRTAHTFPKKLSAPPPLICESAYVKV